MHSMVLHFASGSIMVVRGPPFTRFTLKLYALFHLGRDYQPPTKVECEDAPSRIASPDISLLGAPSFMDSRKQELYNVNQH